MTPPWYSLAHYITSKGVVRKIIINYSRSMHPYYDLFPKIVAANSKEQFQLESLFEPGILAAGSTYGLLVMSRRDFRERLEQPVVVGKDNRIAFEFSPSLQGEYIVNLYAGEKSWPLRPLFQTSFYVVSDDLLRLKPHKGDFHIHTFYSDGRQSPVFMAAKARQIGLDFIAIADHRFYESSLEAIADAEKYGIDILIFPGEEVNYKLGPGHIVSINASASIDRQLRPSGKTDGIGETVESNYPAFAAEIEGRELKEDVDPTFYAFVRGVTKKIRQAGGFAIFAHPYWRNLDVYDLLTANYEQVLADRLFDAIEVFGAQPLEECMISLSRLQDEYLRNPDIPIVANSDAHMSEGHLLGKRWTVAFAEKLDRDSILDAVRNRQTTACLSVTSREAPVEDVAAGNTAVTGPHQLVEYTYFLQREFFPRHDALCRTLGGIYLARLQHGEGDKKTQKQLQEKVRELYERYFARPS